ncbi:MAG: hypothetical protein KGL95_00480 [Patescibacteria group bacterium]|nr:hypothetical protein [Patescibacteria group bacterium]
MLKTHQNKQHVLTVESESLSESESLPGFSSSFIEENKKIKYKKSKKGGPYSKEQRDKRQKEVYKLHFDYGYSARKISEMMKINRNTISRDIDYWYSRILKRHTKPFDPEASIITNIQRLDIQRSRLREELDKAKSIQEKIPVERLIYEIDTKIIYIHNRLAESSRKTIERQNMRINEYLEETHSKMRCVSFDEKISVSHKTHEKISKLIKQDKNTPPNAI